MRILYVSNGNYKHKGERSHCFESRIRNGIIQNGHHLYFMSDRDMARDRGILGRLWGKHYVNETFLSICKNFMPDMILLGQADLITLDSLQAAYEINPHVKIAAYCIDVIFYDHIQDTIQSKLPALDAVFCTTAGPAIKKYFKKDGVSVAYIPNPCDTAIDYVRAETMTDQPHDVFWAMRGGRFSYDNDPRFSIPRDLEKDPDIEIDYYGFDGRPILMDHRYYKAISGCKGGLNISVSRLNEAPQTSDENIYLYSSDRIGHYFGCGLLVYILKGFSLEEMLLPDQHAIYFENSTDLAEKIRYYKKYDNKRIKIAQSGAAHYRTNFNSQKVTSYMIDVTMYGKLKHDYSWKTEIY